MDHFPCIFKLTDTLCALQLFFKTAYLIRTILHEETDMIHTREDTVFKIHSNVFNMRIFAAKVMWTTKIDEFSHIFHVLIQS